VNRFEAAAAEPRDYIAADEERARSQRARQLARRTPDQVLHDRVCALLRAPQPAAILAAAAADPDAGEDSPA